MEEKLQFENWKLVSKKYLQKTSFNVFSCKDLLEKICEWPAKHENHKYFLQHKFPVTIF